MVTIRNLGFKISRTTVAKSLSRAVSEYVAHYHKERNHQGLDNCIPFPDSAVGKSDGEIKCYKRLGGFLKYYYKEAA